MLSDFKARMDQFGGPDRPNMFMVEFFPTSNAIQFEGNLRFFCKSVSFPGITLATKQVRPNSHGPVFEMPYAKQYHNVSCVFILDSKNKILKWFHTWQKSVYGEDQTLRYLRGPNGYGANITITKFSPYDKKVRYVCELSDAYPTELQDVTMSWDENNSYSQLPVTFAFSTYKMTGSDVSDDSDVGLVENLPTIDARDRTVNQYVYRVYQNG